jgi:hypothetical protein
MAKAIEKLKAIAKQRSSAQALKKWAESGGDVPLKYKGREHVWNKKVEKFAAGGFAKLAKKAIGAASESAGMKAPVTATKDLTTLQDFHTSLGDRIRAEAEASRKMMEGFDYKYDKGQRVFTKDSAAKNRPPYEILERTRVGNVPMREDMNNILSKKIIDPETGRAKRTPYEPGYRVRSDQGEDSYEFVIPASAIVGDVGMQAGGVAKLAKALKGAQKADDAGKTSLGEVGSMVTKMGEEGRSPIVPVPNRWFLYPDKFPHQQKMVERVLATTGLRREDFPSGAFVDPRTGEVLDSRIMNELGVVIDPKTNRPMMSAKGESGIERIDPKMGAFTKSNLVRKGLFKPEGGDPLLNDLNFLATIEKGDVGHKYGLATEYASPAELWNTGTGANPTLRPRSRGDLFGVGDVVGRVRVGRSEPHDVYEKLFVAPKGSDVQGVKLSKAAGGEVHMDKGGKVEDKAYVGYRRAGRRPESQQNREASANIPVAVARGLVSGTLGMPGDLESLARLPYELITGNESPTILPTSGDIEKRLPLRGASQTPAGELFTGAGQLAGGAYTGPLSGARAAMAVPRAVIKAGKDFAMAAPQGAPRMFIGPKAKTWDQAKADAAARMEQEGRDPVDIWRQTGTFRGADGIQRQEISDVGATYRNPKQLKELGESKKAQAQELQQSLITPIGQKDFWPKALTEAKKPAREKVKTLKAQADELRMDADRFGHRAEFALEHPELYAAYPELANLQVYQGKKGFGGASAGLMGGKGDMEVNIYQKGLAGNPRSSMLHEMQHAVQTLEDMAPGGNTTTAFNHPMTHEIYKRKLDEINTPVTFEEFQSVNRYPEDKAREAYDDYVRTYKPSITQELDRAIQQEAAMEYYKRLAGEAEARATQFREGMTPSQRAQEFPYSSYDVPPDDLIVNPAKGTVNALQTVYHGSPHKFDRFDASKIGTGEGAQAYGHGLYFAEAPGVAEGYAKTLANRDMANQGRLNAHANAQRLASLAGDPKYAADDIRFVLSNEPDHPQKTLLQDTLAFLDSGDFAKPLETKGNLYTVDLPDEKIARMLDWDKPLGQQSKNVQEAIDRTKSMLPPNAIDDLGGDLSLMYGKDVMPQEFLNTWESFGQKAGGESALQKLGIPGIRYLDEQSRGATGKGKWKITMKNGEQKIYDFKPNDDVLEQMGATAEPAGTSNFVVFPGEENALTILERKKEGGEVGMKGGGEVKMNDGGSFEDKPFIGYRRAGRRPESQQDRRASADIPVAALRGFVSGTLGLPSDLLNLPGAVYSGVTGKDAYEIPFGSEDIERRLPFREVSETPAGKAFTTAGQLAGGAYTGPLSGARAALAVPKAIGKASEDFVLAAGRPAVNVYKPHTPLKPDPDVGRRYKVTDIGGLAPRKNLDIEDLEKSQAKIFPWDATSRNKLVTEVSDVPLTKPVLTEGGDEYMLDLGHIANRIAGASNRGIAERIMTRINEASLENQLLGSGTGKVYGFPVRMGPGAEMAATFPTNIALDFLKQANLSKKELKELDQSMRNMVFEGKKGAFKNMAPFGSPDFIKQLDEGLKTDKKGGIQGFSDMNMRKAFMNRMAMVENQKRMGYNIQDISGAVLADELKGIPKGYVGNVAAELEPFGKLRPSASSTYDTDFPGVYAGSMPNMPVEILMPQRFSEIYREMKKEYPSATFEALRNMTIGALEKRNQGISEKIGPRNIDAVKTFQEGLKQGDFDPYDIKQVYDYMRRKKLGLKFAKGGAVSGLSAVEKV